MTQTESGIMMVIPIIMLLVIPILSATISLSLRAMRDLSELTIGSLMTLSMLVFFGPLVYLMGDNFSFIYDFDALDWLICVGVGIVSSFVQICRIKAVKYAEPAKLAVVNYFQSVFQLIFDVLLLSTVFTAQ